MLVYMIIMMIDQNNIWKFDPLGHPTKTHILQLLWILVYMINLF